MAVRDSVHFLLSMVEALPEQIPAGNLDARDARGCFEQHPSTATAVHRRQCEQLNFIPAQFTYKLSALQRRALAFCF
jgi:hypothetical protein